MSGASQVPSRLEINLVLSGPGTVWLGPIHLHRGRSGRNERRLVERAVGTLVGTMLGKLPRRRRGDHRCSERRGRARRLVLTLLVGMIAVGGGLATRGGGRRIELQPRHVWLPLLAIGGASAVIGLVILPAMRRRFAAEELRRIDALDAGSRS